MRCESTYALAPLSDHRPSLYPPIKTVSYHVAKASVGRLPYW